MSQQQPIQAKPFRYFCYINCKRLFHECNEKDVVVITAKKEPPVGNKLLAIMAAGATGFIFIRT